MAERRGLCADTRGVSEVIGKALGAGLVLLYVGGMTTVLLSGVVPAYETAAANEVSERTLATAVTAVEDAPPAVDGTVEKRVSVELPVTIDNTGYALVLEDGALTLAHPESELTRSANLSLPPSVSAADGRWESGGELTVRVTGPANNRTLAIEEP